MVWKNMAFGSDVGWHDTAWTKKAVNATSGRLSQSKQTGIPPPGADGP